jgi:hypothetical protein
MPRSVIAVLTVSFILASCGGGVNADNYARLKTGMSVEQVHAILGKPDDTTGGGVAGLSGAAHVWRDGDRSITVTFVNEKVTLFVKSGF